MAGSTAADLAEAQRLHRAGQCGAAVVHYERALRGGERADVWLQLGLAYRALRRDPDALRAFQHAARLDPTLAEASHQAGNVLKRLGRSGEAIAALRRATTLAPNHAPAWLNLGVAWLDTEHAAEAVAAFQRAVALEPNRPEAHNVLGVALMAAGNLAAARTAFGEALRQRPSFAPAHNNLARAYKAEGRLLDAIAEYRLALAAQPEAAVHSNLLLALNFVPGLAPADVVREHRTWDALYAAPLGTKAAANVGAQSRPAPGSLHASRPARRLRIGYVSPDFCHHAVAYFIAPVLAAHDRSRVEVFCYASVARPDHHTARLRELAEHWRDIAQLDDEAAADLIRGDEIDLLIDLAGHTARHRLLIFARKPAAAQATWIGYPNTTGLQAMDFRLTDAIADPPGMTDAYHSEKLVRLPTSFSCYEPDRGAPAVNALPASTPGAVAFGCFNNFAKITPAVITGWSRILKALPRSTLLLKSRGLNDPAVVARVRAAFEHNGVDAPRLRFNGDELPVPAHLGLYHGIDIALDPFPYNGTTTTCEALWMGIPVVTLAGSVHAARVGASLLTQVGLGEWIARDEADYVRVAVDAALDLPRLAHVRAGLRERMRGSPLCDAPAFTRGLETVFEELARRS